MLKLCRNFNVFGLIVFSAGACNWLALNMYFEIFYVIIILLCILIGWRLPWGALWGEKQGTNLIIINNNNNFKGYKCNQLPQSNNTGFQGKGGFLRHKLASWKRTAPIVQKAATCIPL